MTVPIAYRPMQEFNDLVLLGKVTDRSFFKVMGERESMGTTASGEDVWRGNELSPAPTSHLVVPTPSTSGEQMTVVSEHVQDTTLGTGVQRIKICYIDANGYEQTENVDMDGTTGVDTVATDIRFINDKYSVLVGSGGVAAGHIKIYKKGTAGLVYNMIAAGGNKSVVPHRMVPVDRTLLLKGWHAEEAQGKRVVLRIRSTDMNGELIDGVFCFKDTAYLNKSTSGYIPINLPIPSLSIVKVSAWPDASGAEASVGWLGEWVDN